MEFVIFGKGKLNVTNKKGGIVIFRLSDLTTVPHGTGTKSKS
jgi:hypothetical protein